MKGLSWQDQALNRPSACSWRSAYQLWNSSRWMIPLGASSALMAAFVISAERASASVRSASCST